MNTVLSLSGSDRKSEERSAAGVAEAFSYAKDGSGSWNDERDRRSAVVLVRTLLGITFAADKSAEPARKLLPQR